MESVGEAATTLIATPVEELIPASPDGTQESQAKEIVAHVGELAKIVESARTRCQHIEDGRGFVARAREEVELNAAEAKRKLDELVDANSKCIELRAQAENAGTAITERKTQADSDATQIAKVAENSAKAEEQIRVTEQQAQSAKENCAAVAEASRNAASILTDLTGKLGTATETAQALTTNAARSHELLGTITGVSTNIAQLKAQAETDATRVKGIADIAAESEQKVGTYEATLATFGEQIQALHKKIEDLLPGATSTGLAEAFRVRKEQFRWPYRGWNMVFIACLVSLVALYAFAFGTLTDIKAASSTQELGFGLLQRLPFAILLVWLALHSARQASIFKRIEEDYAFKEVVSRSFEGYKREMLGIDPTLPSQSVAHQLCSNFLRIVSMSPGRLYESKYRDPTPFSAVGDIAVAVSEAVKKSQGLS